VVLSLSPTSLSSPTMPPPIHVMVSRMTHLHVGLKGAVLRLFRFAPVAATTASFRSQTEPAIGSSATMGSSDDDDVESLNGAKQTNVGSKDQKNASDSMRVKYPVCWFEDEETGTALRWQLFAGVLYDLRRRPAGEEEETSSSSFTLPWKIRVHFSLYPSSQLLELDDSGEYGIMTTVERTFRNSLKQALFLQYASSKVAMNMNKLSHQKIWDAVVHSNYTLYQEVNTDLQAISGDVPERQPDEDRNNNNNNSKAAPPQQIPVRLLINHKPAIQRPCRDLTITLGDLLNEWIPESFLVDMKEPSEHLLSWSVQGIQPPLSASVLDLWKGLCHPDHFLYITLITR